MSEKTTMTYDRAENAWRDIVGMTLNGWIILNLWTIEPKIGSVTVGYIVTYEKQT